MRRILRVGLLAFGFLPSAFAFGFWPSAFGLRLLLVVRASGLLAYSANEARRMQWVCIIISLVSRRWNPEDRRSASYLRQLTPFDIGEYHHCLPQIVS
jgi:hypothetical protein